MSVMVIMGLILWGATLLFGNVKICDTKITRTFPRIIMLMICLFFTGVIFTILGLFGLIILAPILQFFGWNWFIVLNF